MNSIQQTIKELEAKIRPYQDALDSLRALNTNGDRPRTHPANKPGQTIIGAIIAHLRKTGAKQTSAQLREAVQAAGVEATGASIQTIMSKRGRMKKDLVRKGRGMWALREWKSKT